ncbi:MAG: hypothetical protein HOP09_00530 [Hyphomicrobium sp.]|nr:hypothetical protein [Hyphomicrobium sp.]
MSTLTSGALLSLFSGFSFEGVQRAHQKRETKVLDTMSYDAFPAPSAAVVDLASAPPEIAVTAVIKKAA